MSEEKRPIDPQGAVESMWKTAPAYAKAKATRVHIEEFRKAKKALLMNQFRDLPLGAQEREAYSHPEYIQLLDALKVAVEEEETLRWQLLSCQTAVDVWRSQNASNRAIDRSAA